MVNNVQTLGITIKLYKLNTLKVATMSTISVGNLFLQQYLHLACLISYQMSDKCGKITKSDLKVNE